MRIRDLLSSEPVQVVGSDATVAEAAQHMLEHDVGLLPVVEGERLVGVLTDRDIVLRCVAQDKLGKTLPVREVMSVEIVCGFDDQTVDEAKAIMADNGIQRLPITNRQYRLVGVLSLAAMEGKPDPQKKPVKVTLFKEKTDSYGRPHKVSLRTVYVTGKDNDEEAKSAAAKVVEEEHNAPLTKIADGLESEKMPNKPDKRGQP